MIINEIAPNGDLFGYTDNMKQIIIKASDYTKNLKIWMMIPIRITKGVVFKLEWEIIQ